MRPQGPTFFLLGGSTKNWRTASVRKISVGEKTLTLTGLQDGRDSLVSKDGSLGRVVLPIGMATDDRGTLYLLRQREPGVKRFDRETCSFVRLEGIGDTFGSEIGQFYEQFKDPCCPVRSNIAVAGHNLYVADLGNRRVQVFALGTRAIRHVWGPRDDKGRRVKASNPRAWEPADVASHDERAYILDRHYSRVYLHRPGTDRLKLLVHDERKGICWTRIALDKEGRIYVLDIAPPTPKLEVFDQHGRHLETKTSSAEIRDRFDPPAVQLNEEEKSERRKLEEKECQKKQEKFDDLIDWSFTLPENLRLQCEQCATEKGRLSFQFPCDHPKPAEQPPAIEKVLRFDVDGKPWKRTSKLTGSKAFEEQGQWLSEALDSRIYNCQWHRIELEISRLPAGTRVEVFTYSNSKSLPVADIDGDKIGLMDKFGALAYSVAGKLDSPKNKSTDASRHEFLVQSREGQFVWLRIKLIGDGFDTPAIDSMRIHYPRSSYLEYLPAIYSADDDSRWFLERFLSIFQTEWDRLEQRIDDVAALFDPKAVPAGKALEFLASWFALPLEGTWSEEQKRELLKAVAGIYFGSWKARTDKGVCLSEGDPAKATRRGTREGVRRYLQVYLQNITGLDATEQGAFPQIDEGFRERQRLMLALGNTAALSHCAPLWSSSVVGRLQFGQFAQEGEARLVSTGNPELEIFEEFSHRFRVFVPSSWIGTADDEEMVHRAIREEKPAHTSYELCLVEPRFRIGLQSTVGVDTILGAWPKAHLTCTHDKNIPPSRQPRHRLGFDTILASRPGDQPTLQVGPKTRTGLDTLLN
jgi:phage tail-like protein